MASQCLVERHGPVALVTLNRPDRLNALDAELMDELRALWPRLDAQSDVRCVVVTGAGRGFCAGADRSLLASDRSAAPQDVSDELSFLPGPHLRVPVIAAINGPCAGGGLHFVADADIVVAAASATFSDPHVSVGHISGLEPASLALRMRMTDLSRMVLLGAAQTLDAESALAAGLVSEVTTDDALVDRALELAGQISAASPRAVEVSRRLMRELNEALTGSALQRGWDEIRSHWAHPDALEGPAAAMERRPPVWSTPDLPQEAADEPATDA
jgi:enoyl-CoA hydratase/carnithine racemase